ncbi:MAG: SWIM zinc finger family protein [Synechococcales cyanobacterium T60_A2020_003]|nr:SWIM zinc finger family protein [Synechococcales cyanobacterium T60_A2020_003]
MSSYEAQSNREWWAQRWVDVLESFGWIRRLERARNYAREGNVVKLVFKGAKVKALVQGTAPEPYDVSLSLDVFDDEQWQYVIESIAERAIFSAKLLAGEMPQDIEQVFTSNGLSLFPLTKFDIHSRCSCPDKANPCKHIGAVYYILGDRFSEDPFVLFQLRGRTKTQIINDLRRLRTEAGHPTVDTGTNEGQQSQAELLSDADTPALEESRGQVPPFWHYDEPLESSLVVITPPANSETLLDMLGPIPLKVAASNLVSGATQAVMEDLRAIYTHVSQQAVVQGMMAGSESGNGNES